MAAYIVQFIIGGTVMMLAAMLSQSKYLFLSGVITLLPILTLMNLNLQVHNMTAETFHMTQRNGIIGAIGMIVLMLMIYYCSGFMKPAQSVLVGVGVYVVFMVVSKVTFA
ncbi:GlpM family protein [Kurthia huakuii]|uniref:GlpM family protein n=1 Tax=Kurthia huakuii TaxID=1421019 RepID=UPI0004B71B54|nr:GlpM family protein [Kurthia huakuii]MBM7697707.1 putative membrane protein (GlpM family) [Kurthia huakuii]